MAYVEYTARFLTLTQLERDRDNPLSLLVYNGASSATPSSGTFTLINASGSTVTSGAVTVTGGAATYTVTSAMLSGQSFGPGWRVEWSLVMPDTYTHLYINEAACVRLRYGVQTADIDLYDLHPELASYLPSGASSWQTQRERAHANVWAMLNSKGKPPYRIVDRTGPKQIELYEALGIVCGLLAGTGNEDNKWSRLADHYRERAQRTFETASFIYDDSDDGAPGLTDRKPAVGSLWLGSSGRRLPARMGR